ncbi:MAG: amidohydrolase family protein [Planctomycetes bacterium]|nr:amidohydrolase family protein [Planctomycetota bacterium]
MMILNTLLLVAAPALSPASTPPPQGVMALKVGRAETVSDGSVLHAVILIEDGKITMVGEDLPIERGIPVIDLGPDSVVIPGLVNAYSRQGMDSRGGSGSEPGNRASSELYPAYEDYSELLDAGITTLGLYPAGNGIPGRAVAVRTKGDTREEMILKDDAYLKVILQASGSSKKMIRDGFEKADKWIEKEQKEREKWEKDKEKADKKKKDDDKDKDAKDAGPGPYVAPDKDPEAEAFLALRAKELRALISIDTAAEYLHLVDAIGKEEFDWDLRIPIQRESNVFYVAEMVGKRGCRVVMDPVLSLHPNTMRQRNLPNEFAKAGAKLVLTPRSDSTSDNVDWLTDVGGLVTAGLPPKVALRAMTLEPAEVLGLGDRLGSISAGKDANLVFFDRDPFEPGVRPVAVMLEGQIVSGEVN